MSEDIQNGTPEEGESDKTETTISIDSDIQAIIQNNMGSVRKDISKVVGTNFSRLRETGIITSEGNTDCLELSRASSNENQTGKAYEYTI